ncbi:MAG: uracil-DNA glycosylase [Paracoccus sp. (in: a-proteobacteria)]|uniref:uracil-DNA glycosylase n=1 Tax=Paracoccus sp. TaxID=267 RepID=UPI0026DEF70D|nr:uracil-DNA glycosylase [Paracoccus sp. (in: a-proteobacteria)]MDO5621461.1 uracil-DNA glycosylase [Paracoccus sp. (in: a-proteobacteria)]
MNGDPTWRGLALDGAAALALLEWQAEFGVDEAILDSPQDRFEEAQRPAPVAPAVAAPPPAAKPAQPDEPDRAAVMAEAMALAARAQSLPELAELQQGFDGIELKKGALNFVFSDGNPKARLLILGEAPGNDEDAQGKPFVGRAGQLLDRMLAAIGLDRHSPDAERAAYITNVLAWHPPGNRRPTDAEIALSLPFVRRHIELADPDVIVLMGNTPCKAALGREGILKLRGNWTEAFGKPALPMTHPAYLLRTAIAKREAWADLLAVAARLDLPPV